MYLETQIGCDTSFQYRHRLNASNIVEEIDANAMYIYARGYFDYEEGGDENAEKNAGQTREYTSPLAAILGKRDAPPIKNGKIKDPDFMLDQLETLVEGSLKVSVTSDIHDLRRQGYALSQPQLGDRNFLIDERIQYNQEVRIVNMSITKNWKGKVLDLKLTFGSQGLGKRHQSNLSTASKQMTELLAGRLQIPFSVLPSAKQSAVRKLEQALTELIFGDGSNGVQGIIAQDKNDPNKLMWMNSNGWMISTDGGVTPKVAATADGLVTETLTAGSIFTNNIAIIGDALFYWDGTGFHSFDPDDLEKFIRILGENLYIAKGAATIERPDGYKVVDNGMLNLEYSVQFTPTPFIGEGILHEGTAYTTISQQDQFIANGRFRRDGRYLKLMVGLWVDEPGETAVMTVTSQGSTPETYATIKETFTDGDYEIVQRELTIDLGVPNGARGSFYVNLRSQNGTKVRGYVRAGWLEE